MSKPTPEEIKAEIAKLREMKPNVRHYTLFGDNKQWPPLGARLMDKHFYLRIIGTIIRVFRVEYS